MVFPCRRVCRRRCDDHIFAGTERLPRPGSLRAGGKHLSGVDSQICPVGTARARSSLDGGVWARALLAPANAARSCYRGHRDDVSGRGTCVHTALRALSLRSLTVRVAPTAQSCIHVGFASEQPQPRCQAEIVFVWARAAILISRCSWHLCPIHRRMSTVNGTWWERKPLGNRDRVCAPASRYARRDLDSPSSRARAVGPAGEYDAIVRGF